MKKLISMVLLLAMTFPAAFNVAHAEEETVKAALLADTYVECRTAPAVNHGSEDCVLVKRSGVCAYTLLKFELPDIGNKSVKSAKLRLANRNDPNAATVGVEYYTAKLSDDSWDENTVTGNNVYSSYTKDGEYKFPASGTEKVYTAYPDGTAKYSYVELDATSVICYDYLMGNKMTTLVVGTDTDKGTTGSNLSDWKICGQLFNSGKYAPELVLTLGAPSYSEITVTSDCIANNFTNNAQPDTVQNGGASGNIVLTRNQRDGYFQFDISSIPEGFTVTNAELTLVSDRKSDFSDGILKIYGSDNGWTETDITYNNAPDTGRLYAESKYSDDGSSIGVKHSFNVTDYLQEKAYNGNSEVSLKISSVFEKTTSANDNVNIYNRKNTNSARHPSMVITVTNDPSIAALVEDKVNIVLPETAYENIALPVSGANGSVITWTSSDESAIAADGTVVRGDTDKTVTLTARISLEDKITEKAFRVLVPEYIPDGGKVTFYDSATGELVSVLGDTETVDAKVKLIPAYTGKASLIVARYTQSGELQSAEIQDVNLTSGETFGYDILNINSSRANSIKIMMWNDMKPVLINQYFIGR